MKWFGAGILRFQCTVRVTPFSTTYDNGSNRLNESQCCVNTDSFNPSNALSFHRQANSPASPLVSTVKASSRSPR